MRPKFTSILIIFLLVFSSFILLSTFVEPFRAEGEENYAPQINSTYPANGALDISTDGIPINAYIYDFENDSLWTEIWSNHTGVWVQYAGFNLGVADYENTSFIVDFDNNHDWNMVDYLHYHDNSGWVESGQYAFWENNSVTNSWGMNQSANTYYWSINTTDNITWTNQTFHFSTVDNPPSITNESPYDGAIDVELNPTICANLSDADGNALNVTFWTNATGSWELIGYNASVNNGTYSQNTFNMNNYNTKYWWSVNATDGIKWTNDTYNFTTILADVFVDDDEVPGWYDAIHVITIQEAIDNASAGNRIYVYNGTYYEKVIVNKTINLIGEDKNKTIIDGGYNGDVLSVYNNWVNISGFTIQNSQTNYTGISVYSNNVSISNSIIKNNTYGVYFCNSTNNTIVGNIITNNTYGIYLYNSSYINISLNDIIENTEYGFFINLSNYNNINNNSIDNNTNIYSPGFGIRLDYSTYNNLFDNEFFNNSILIYGEELSHYIHAIQNNTVNGKQLYYFKNNNSGINIPLDAGAVILVNCTNAAIADLEMSFVDVGVEIAYSDNITISNCSMINDTYGLYSIYTDSSNISKNTFNNNYYAIYISNSNNNTINSNNFTNNNFSGILMCESNFTSIEYNNINTTLFGIIIALGENNWIRYNTFNTTLVGLMLNYSQNNIIYYNNFFLNINESYAIDNSDNTWYSTIILNGNYWDDFDEPNERAFDNNSDGIVDKPYNISNGDNQDLYPLTGPWGQRPYQATLIFPADAATGVSTSPILKVRLSDPNNDTMNVTFYSSPGDTVIGTYTNVTNGDNAFVTWSGLSPYTSYSWYVVVNDSTYLTKSDTWTFKTKTKTTGGSGGGGGTSGGGTLDDETNLTNPPTSDPNGPYNALTYQPIRFDGSGSTDDGTIIDYKWTFGDGSTDWGIKPFHTYNTSGVFVVTLTVTDDTNLTDSKTTTANITLDTDGDGWSDEDEDYYNSDKQNVFDTPLDTDDDGIIDFDDEDDDNDIVSDEIEIKLGTNPKKKDITIKIFNGIAFYLIDLDGDGIPDRFYNTSSEKDINVKIRDDGTYLLNINGDSYWDYVYDPASGEATTYKEKKTSSEGLPWITIASVIVIVIVAIFIILYLFGFIWIEKE